MQKDDFTNYSVTTKAFHHIRLTLLVLIYLCIITYAAIPRSYPIESVFFMLHAQLGFTLLIVIILNIIWRLFNKYPNSFAINSFEAKIEIIVKVLLYVVVFVTPLVGLAKFSLGVNHILTANPAANYSMFTIKGLTVIPYFIIKGYAAFLGSLGVTLKTSLGFYHKLLAIFILPALIALHLIALIYHQFIRKNGILKRMF